MESSQNGKALDFGSNTYWFESSDSRLEFGSSSLYKLFVCFDICKLTKNVSDGVSKLFLNIIYIL